MSISMKTLQSLSLAVLLAVTLFCDAAATPSHAQARTNLEIEACVAEIRRHADYNDAVKVIHWVASLEQAALRELRIVIDTTVVLNAGDETREYRASCVTDTMRRVVEFRIDRAQPGTITAKRNDRS